MHMTTDTALGVTELVIEDKSESLTFLIALEDTSKKRCKA